MRILYNLLFEFKLLGHSMRTITLSSLCVVLLLTIPQSVFSQALPIKDLSIGNRFYYIRSSESVQTVSGPLVNRNGFTQYTLEKVLDTVWREGKRYSAVRILNWDNTQFTTSISLQRSDSTSIYVFDATSRSERRIFKVEGEFASPLTSLNVYFNSSTPIELFGKKLMQYQYGAFTISLCTPVKEIHIQTLGFYSSQYGCSSHGGLRSSSTRVLLGAIIGKDTLNDVPDPKIATVALPPITQILPRETVMIPITLSGIDSLGEVFSEAPRLTVLFNKRMLALTNLPPNYVIDSTVQNDTVRLSITPPLNSSTLATLQFRMNPNTELSETTVALSLERKATKTLAFLIPEAGRIMIAPRKTATIFRFLVADSLNVHGDTATIGAYLTGTRDIAESGIRLIQATIPIPLTVAQPLATFASMNGYAMVPMEFILSTNSNAASTSARVRIITTSSISVPLELTNLKAIPNAINFDTFGNTAFLRVTGSSRSPLPQAVDTFTHPHIISIAPNPTHYDISISYSLPRDSFVSIAVYDMQGNIVQTLMRTMRQSSGEHTEKFLIYDLPPNEYRLVLQTDDKIIHSRIMLSD